MIPEFTLSDLWYIPAVFLWGIGVSGIICLLVWIYGYFEKRYSKRS